MSKTITQSAKVDLLEKLRSYCSKQLGVTTERKQEIYIELAEVASLKSFIYWVEIIFACGIATLGLVLGSPAVIIGAMLISPLMGPILSAGLALATGDLVLGLRVIVKLLLSIFLAITFSTTLVAILPFKEMTSEIAARTEPNTLDLFVALFSGFVGTMAICRESKGVMTSIPGVSIAVALMPPLSVVGYGTGLALTFDSSEGLRIASGGGLLFLTNLAAITFAAMLVFLLIKIDVVSVRDHMHEWKDVESTKIRNILSRLHFPMGFRRIGALPGRFLLIFLSVALVLVPLNRSFSKLKIEIEQKRWKNRVRQSINDIWQQQLGKHTTGEKRSYLDQVLAYENEEGFTIQLRALTNKPSNVQEKEQLKKLVAAQLGKPFDKVKIDLIEIPTTDDQFIAREVTKIVETESIYKVESRLKNALESVASRIMLPPHATMLSLRLITTVGESMKLELVYLSERKIDSDGETLLTENVKNLIGTSVAKIDFKHIPVAAEPIVFELSRAELTETAVETVDNIGKILREYTGLKVEITTNIVFREKSELIDKRRLAVSSYLASKWQVAENRIRFITGIDPERSVKMALKLQES
ncbi:MAG: DUF389 domain-containing protein [Blastocatellia bacterium]|nr:DUF389 domain-containing protein [Blastocatellia bacterium]